MIDPNIPNDRYPFHLQAGSTGILLLHGFMGSPKSLRAMAEYLVSKGYTVRCPLLPGHGHLPARLHGVSHKEWLRTAQLNLDELRGTCDKLFILGHSMGTIPAAHTAHHNSDLSGLILLAPLYVVPTKWIYTMSVFRYIIPWVYPLKRIDQELVEQRILDFDASLDFTDEELQLWLNEGTKLPTSALDELRKIAKVGRSVWDKLTVPVILLQGGKDDILNPQFADTIFEEIPSAEKQFVLYPDSKHDLMQLTDPLHQDVWDAVVTFIQTRENDTL